MPASRGFLERFRASGTPGAAAHAGVPADRVAERETELADVFDRLAATEALAATIREDGVHRADQHRTAASGQARRVLSMARSDAEAERREAASRISALADEETETTMEAAERAATDIRAHTARVLPDYVQRTLALVRERLDQSEPATRDRP